MIEEDHEVENNNNETPEKLEKNGKDLNEEDIGRKALCDMLDTDDFETVNNKVMFGNQKEKQKDTSNKLKEGICIECEYQEANVFCNNCKDYYCFLCFQAQHKKGKRKNHVSKIFKENTNNESSMEVDETPVTNPSLLSLQSYDDSTAEAAEKAAKQVILKLQSVEERAKYIPLRLSYSERKYLRLLEGAMKVSEYTDKIDIQSFGNKSKRMHSQIREICAILSGLIISSDYSAGQELLKERNFKEYGHFFSTNF